MASWIKSLVVVLGLGMMSAMHAVTMPARALSPSLPWVKQHCQCPQCDLAHANLNDFQPAMSHAHPVSAWPFLTCRFDGANFSHAQLNHVDFRVSFRGVITALRSASFVHANLQAASLQRGRFYANDFAYANLTQANLSGSDISLANFRQANLIHAQLINTTARRDAMHGWGANFYRANFSHANLTHARLSGCFIGARFNYANLQAASLTQTDCALAFPRLDFAALMQRMQKPINFSHANLRGAQLNFSTLDLPVKIKLVFCHTVMPDGKLNNRDCR